MFDSSVIIIVIELGLAQNFPHSVSLRSRRNHKAWAVSPKIERRKKLARETGDSALD
jgi:hypothetical protein